MSVDRRAMIETMIIQLSVADNNQTLRSDVTRVNNGSGREDSIDVLRSVTYSIRNIEECMNNLSVFKKLNFIQISDFYRLGKTFSQPGIGPSI